MAIGSGELESGDKLTAAARHRYFVKLIDIAGIDLYEIPKISWSINPNDLPEIC